MISRSSAPLTRLSRQMHISKPHQCILGRELRGRYWRDRWIGNWWRNSIIIHQSQIRDMFTRVIGRKFLFRNRRDSVGQWWVRWEILNILVQPKDPWTTLLEYRVQISQSDIKLAVYSLFLEDFQLLQPRDKMWRDWIKIWKLNIVLETKNWSTKSKVESKP